MIALGPIARAAAQSKQAQKSRTKTQKRHAAQLQAWIDSGPPVVDENTYVHEIQPKLASLTFSAIASALQVSEPYARDIRAGRRRPHPRHWQALTQLAGVSTNA